MMNNYTHELKVLHDEHHQMDDLCTSCEIQLQPSAALWAALWVWGAALMISRAVENPCIARLRSYGFASGSVHFGRRLEGDL